MMGEKMIWAILDMLTFETSSWQLDSPAPSSGTSSRLEIMNQYMGYHQSCRLSLTGLVACRWFSYNPQQKYIFFHSPVHMYTHIMDNICHY